MGEAGAIITAHVKGFKPTDFPSKYPGIDSVWEDGHKLVVVEAKGGAADLGDTLAGGQMSQAWINDKIRKLAAGGPDERAWAERLSTAAKEGRLQGMLVKTPDGGVPEFDLKDFDEIGELTW